MTPGTLPTSASPALPALILAAGLSSRMGAFKPLLPCGPFNTPILQHLLETLSRSQAVSTLTVVIGHHADDVQAFLRQHVPAARTVFNPNYATGEMLSSLKAGLSTAFCQPDNPPAFLLALADQPAVLPATIARLVHSFFAAPPGTPLIIPTFLAKRGHPLILSSRLIPEILALAPDDSLKTVVHRHLKNALLIPVDDPATLEDLDTPADVARARQRWSNARAPIASTEDSSFSPVLHGESHG